MQPNDDRQGRQASGTGSLAPPRRDSQRRPPAAFADPGGAPSQNRLNAARCGHSTGHPSAEANERKPMHSPNLKREFGVPDRYKLEGRRGRE
jgi:hypothetical protein